MAFATSYPSASEFATSAVQTSTSNNILETYRSETTVSTSENLLNFAGKSMFSTTSDIQTATDSSKTTTNILENIYPSSTNVEPSTLISNIESFVPINTAESSIHSSSVYFNNSNASQTTLQTATAHISTLGTSETNAMDTITSSILTSDVESYVTSFVQNTQDISPTITADPFTTTAHSVKTEPNTQTDIYSTPSSTMKEELTILTQESATGIALSSEIESMLSASETSLTTLKISKPENLTSLSSSDQEHIASSNELVYSQTASLQEWSKSSQDIFTQETATSTVTIDQAGPYSSESVFSQESSASEVTATSANSNSIIPQNSESQDTTPLTSTDQEHIASSNELVYSQTASLQEWSKSSQDIFTQETATSTVTIDQASPYSSESVLSQESSASEVTATSASLSQLYDSNTSVSKIGEPQDTSHPKSSNESKYSPTASPQESTTIKPQVSVTQDAVISIESVDQASTYLSESGFSQEISKTEIKIPLSITWLPSFETTHSQPITTNSESASYSKAESATEIQTITSNTEVISTSTSSTPWPSITTSETPLNTELNNFMSKAYPATTSSTRFDIMMTSDSYTFSYSTTSVSTGNMIEIPVTSIEASKAYFSTDAISSSLTTRSISQSVTTTVFVRTATVTAYLYPTTSSPPLTDFTVSSDFTGDSIDILTNTFTTVAESTQTPEPVNAPKPVSPTTAVSLGVTGGVIAVGAAAALAIFYRSRTVSASQLRLAGSDPILGMARQNPLYETPGGVHDNPLYQPPDENNDFSGVVIGN
jgi:hypothetical protein